MTVMTTPHPLCEFLKMISTYRLCFLSLEGKVFTQRASRRPTYNTVLIMSLAGPLEFYSGCVVP